MNITRKRAALALLLGGLCAIGLTAPAQADATVRGTVANTEGLTLFVRSGPGTGTDIVTQLDEGTAVDIECQIEAQNIEGNAVWDYLPAYAGYAADHYLDTAGHDGRHPDLPLCDEGEEPPPSGDIRDVIVDLAKGELGNTDKSRYGAPADHDWCQYFVNWVWRNAGVEDMNDTHFTGDFYYWGKERGLTRDGYEDIQVGDAVLFGTGPSQEDTGRHVAIVIDTHADGSFTTIDGNYTRDGVNAVHEVGPTYPWDASPPEPENVYAVVSPPGGTR